MTDVKWPGTDAEMTEFAEVMLRLMKQDDPACGCKLEEVKVFSPMTTTIIPAVTCSTHREARENQRWLNGLVMMRRRRQRLLREEGVDL